MSRFIAAADESVSGDGSGEFYFGGFIAPERDWSEYFEPAWRERVLETNPKLAYLHMAEIKSSKWRSENGINEIEADRKIGEAFRIIRSQGSLYPLVAHLNAAHFRAAIEKANVRMNIRTPGGIARTRFDPDYLCFTRFALSALLYVRDTQVDAEKVDFMIERNGPITRHIGRFHASIEKTLRRDLDRADLADLVGDLIPGGKERQPLQAADFLCWYLRNASRLGPLDRSRFEKMMDRAGYATRASDAEINDFAERAANAELEANDPDFEGIRGAT